MATQILNILTGTPNTGTTIHGFRFRIYFYEEYISPGKTKLTWEVYNAYELINPNYPATSSYSSGYITLSFSASQGSISNITNTSYSSSKIWFKQTPTKLFNGSCEIQHDGSGVAKISYYADVSFAGTLSGGYPGDISGNLNISDNMPYTKCSPPTYVSTSGIITPFGKFTVNWDGATAGHANDIIGYRVYYSLTSSGIAPTTSTTTYQDVDALTTSAEFQLSNATRGDKIVCGVVAKGSQEGFDSDIKTGGLVTINFLPAAPTASVNKTVVPSTGGQVTFTITAGIDSDSSQTRTLYYSTSASSSSTKTEISSSWSPTIENTETYYFWTYDGLEYSEKPSPGITITKNTKPDFDVTISSQSLVSVNNLSNYNYTVSPTITLSNIRNGQPTKKYIYTLKYGNNTSTTSSKVLYNLDSATQKTISDIRSLGVGHESNGAYYRFSIQCYDGVEYSDIKTTELRYVTKIPSLIGLYNKTDFSNITGFYIGNVATYYSKFLGFQFQKDEGYNTLKFNNYSGASQIINLITNATDTRGSWTTTEEIFSSVNYDLSYQLGYSSGYTHSATTQNITKIAKVSLSNFKFALSGQSYKFFTDLSTYTNTVGHSYSSSPLIANAIKEYGINSILSSNHLFVKIYSNNFWTNAINVSPNSTTNNSTIDFNLTAASMANIISALFTNNQKNNSYSSTIRLYIKNDFGDESWIDSNFSIDFRENNNIQLMSIDIHPSSNDNKLDQWQYLKEGMGNLIGNFTIKSYNTNPKGEIQILRSTETNWQTLKTFTFSGSGNAEPNSPITYSISNLIVQTIGEISNFSYNVDYRLIVTTDAGSKTFTLYSNIPVRGHVPAVLVIQNNSYDGTNLTIGYNITNFGADITNLKLGNNNKISLYLDEETTVKSTYTDNSSNYFTTSSKSAIFPYDFLNSESSLIKLGISTVLYTYLKTDASNAAPYFGTTKTTNLNSIDSTPVFNILPTIAYRKNHLGINILEPSVNSDAIIVIGEASGRDAIYFQPANNNLCRVVNFHLDGGSW